MICKFNSKLICQEIVKNCFECDFNVGQKTLDGDIVKKSTILYCPFCLSSGKIDDFILTNRKGGLMKIKKCKVCNNKMLTNTLLYVKNLNPSEFAEWIFDYPRQDYWLRANRKILYSNMYFLNISREFWDRYNELRESVKRDVETEFI